MTKTSLFADQEREAKLNKLGEALRLLELRHWPPKSIMPRRAAS